MKNKDFTQWFIDELEREEIEFYQSYSSYSDKLTVTVWNKHGQSTEFIIHAKGGLKELINVYNSIMKFSKENNNE